MKHFLICSNKRCRFVLDLPEEIKTLPTNSSLAKCPECGSQWSSNCPFCTEPLRIAVQKGHPHCFGCRRKLRAEDA